MVKIYQIRDINNCKYYQKDFSIAKFNFADYELVHQEELDANLVGLPRRVILERLWIKFNTGNETSRMRKLDVSDVVELDGHFYYVNRKGYLKLGEEIF